MMARRPWRESRRFTIEMKAAVANTIFAFAPRTGISFAHQYHGELSNCSRTEPEPRASSCFSAGVSA
jgi:hypothetical protein